MENDENTTFTRCPFCAEKINALAKKCRYCGEIIDPALKIATDIKNHNTSGVKVNIVSGNDSSAAPQPQVATVNNIAITTEQPKERTVYILLGVFLGALGIHNFYAGYTNKGITQLLITLIAGWLILPYIAVTIWSIIEACTVTKDSKGIPFC